MSVKGVPPTPGFLAAWDVAADGTLSADFQPSTPATGGLLPFSATLVDGQNALLVTDPGAGFSVYDLNTLSVVDKTPANSSIIAVAGQKAVCWSNFSPKTGNYYLTGTVQPHPVPNSTLMFMVRYWHVHCYRGQRG